MTTEKKRSKSSMTSTKIFSTKEDFLDIIEKCASVGVKSLKVGELEVVFQERNIPVPSTEVIPVSSGHEDVEQQTLISDQERQIEKKSANLATLHISDPLAYEEELMLEDNIKELEDDVEGMTHGQDAESDDDEE